MIVYALVIRHSLSYCTGMQEKNTASAEALKLIKRNKKLASV